MKSEISNKYKILKGKMHINNKQQFAHLTQSES